MLSNHLALTASICDIARAAGQVITQFRLLHPTVPYRVKEDTSPITEADAAANKLITQALGKLTPEIPIVAEESVACGEVPDIHGNSFWLVDPLDGTKEFIGGRSEFTVNIALIVNNAPALGVIYLPALNTIYWGGCELGAQRQEDYRFFNQLRTRTIPTNGPTVVSSRSHSNSETEQWLSKARVAQREVAGSSVKFCRIAEGRADLYPRLGTTMEWDIAAGHSILAAAGGSVETIEGAPLRYGKPDFKNPYFIARGR